jgi:hypothetical protein
MATSDPERDLQRLAHLYASMSDGQLERLAGEAGSLSDVAREALRLELSRRGSEIALQEPTAAWDGKEVPGPITLRQFRDLPKALLAKTILDSANVECFLADDNIVRLNWLLSNLVGGVKLWVRPEDVDAVSLLDQDYLEAFDVEGVGKYKQPRCPNCQSFDISFQELMKDVAYGSISLAWVLAFPALIPLKRLGWKCHSCGHAWEGSNEPPEQAP